MALGRLDIIMAADMAQLRKDMNTAVGIMQSGAKQMESVAKTAATTMAGYFTFDYFKENIKQTLEYADSLNKLSQKSGITAEALYSLNAAAKLSDVSFESLQKSLVKFNKNIGEASKGSGDALIAFKSFGMNIKNQDGTLKNSFELIGDLADQFENMPDGVSKTTLAMQLFGKSGADMIPLLNSGKESLREYLGVIDQDTAKAAEEFNDSFTRMHLAASGKYMKTLKELTPTISILTDHIIDLADESNNLSDSFSKKLAGAMKDVVKWGYGVASVFDITKDALSNFGQSFGALLGGDEQKTQEYFKKIGIDFEKDVNKWGNAIIDLDKAEETYAQNKEKREKKRPKADTGLTDYQIQITQISNQIQALAKQYDIKKQIKDLDIETQLRNMQISQPYSDYLKTENEILTSISKNEETISLLRQKADKETSEGGRIEDLQKINDLQKENELQQLKITANKEKYNQLISIGNSQLRDSISALDMSDIDKKYQDLAKSVQDLIIQGRDLKLVGEYATKVADQLKREDAYNHLQKELEIRKDTIELTMYGSEKETALESLRHEEVLANLQRELETRKVNYDEYLKLMNLEMTRHAQNADEFRKFMLSAFDNIEKALDSNFFDAIQGKFKSFGDWLKSFFKNIGNSIAQGLSRTLAGGIVNSLRSSLFSNMGTGLTLGSLAVGSAVSASEISTIMNSGGTFDSATNTITTSGGTAIKLAENGTGTVDKGGTDILGVASMISSVKTAYDVLTAGISSSILTGFQGASGLLASAGMGGAASGLMSFGAGFANPFAYAGMSGLPTAMTIGSAASAGLLGGAVGYGTGWLGDKLFGANTYASMGGLAGGALGGILASLGVVGGPLGILGGSLLGSALGGIFGKKKETDSGIQFFQNMDALDTLSNQTVRAYQDWQKKGWFSSSSGTEMSDLSANQMKQIEAVFDTYDYLLTQLGDSDRITLEAGKYSGETFADALTKNFITAFTDVNQSLDSTIYDSWVEYAKSIDKTVTEALATSINSFITEKRTFEIWQVGASSVEGLAKKAQFAKEDLDNLANSLGATGVTVENYLQRYNEAVKNSFDAQTIASWKSLGDALMSATDASKAYNDALKAQETALKQANEAIRQSAMTTLASELTAWVNALGSVQSAIDALKPTLKSFDELKNTTLTLDNYSTLLSQLEETRQNEINTLTTAANVRIEQLNNEKSLFQTLSSFIDELNIKLLGSNVTTSDYFFSELDKAKATLKNGGVVDTSKLTASANSYLDSALRNSTSQLEYFRELAKVKDGIGSLGGMVTGGTLESVEAAIKTEEQTLAQKLDTLNQTALAILGGWKGTASAGVSSATASYNAIKEDAVAKAYSEVLGRTADAEGYAYWSGQIASGAISAAGLNDAIANVAANFDASSYTGTVSSGVIQESIQNAREWINGFSSGGYTGDGGINDIAGVVHGKEYVVNAKTTQDLGLNNGSGGVFKDMANEIKELRTEVQYLREVTLKTASETTRTSKLLDRVCPDGDALQVRITA